MEIHARNSVTTWTVSVDCITSVSRTPGRFQVIELTPEAEVFIRRADHRSKRSQESGAVLDGW